MAKPSLQAVIHACLANLAATQPLSPRQWQVCHHIGTCRTEALGGLLLECGGCGESAFLYYACHDRRSSAQATVHLG